mgnify:CR=1 FL=1
MVNVDTVYQKVLALCNKEQRGYMTPQEFNLLADKAQMEIFDEYFHNMKTAVHKASTRQSVAFDEVEMLQEKLHPFQMTVTADSTFTNVNTLSTLTLPDTYYLNVIRRTTTGAEVTELTPKEIVTTQNNPLTAATLARMVYVRAQGSTTITIYPILSESINFTIDYYARPTAPEWAYVVVKKRALYNANASINFVLHASEEEYLVSRILQLAGIVIMKPGLVEVGAAEVQTKKMEQNN